MRSSRPAPCEFRMQRNTLPSVMEDWKRADFFRHNYENVHSSETKLYTVYKIKYENAE